MAKWPWGKEQVKQHYQVRVDADPRPAFLRVHEDLDIAATYMQAVYVDDVDHTEYRNADHIVRRCNPGDKGAFEGDPKKAWQWDGVYLRDDETDEVVADNWVASMLRQQAVKMYEISVRFGPKGDDLVQYLLHRHSDLLYGDRDTHVFIAASASDTEAYVEIHGNDEYDIQREIDQWKKALGAEPTSVWRTDDLDRSHLEGYEHKKTIIVKARVGISKDSP